MGQRTIEERCKIYLQHTQLFFYTRNSIGEKQSPTVFKQEEEWLPIKANYKQNTYYLFKPEKMYILRKIYMFLESYISSLGALNLLKAAKYRPKACHSWRLDHAWKKSQTSGFCLLSRHVIEVLNFAQADSLIAKWVWLRILGLCEDMAPRRLAVFELLFFKAITLHPAGLISSGHD